MSLVENIARRSPRASETLDQVGALKSKGYSDAEIGRKIGCTAAWVNIVVNLLERGERKLLAAVEAGHIPLNIAIQIARATDAEAQDLLLEAYNRGDLKGKNVAVMRKILEQRQRSGKSFGPKRFGRVGANRSMSPEDLAQLYQRNTEEHKRLQRRAEHAQSTLLVMQQIFKELLSNTDFQKLLKSEGLTTLPKPLVELARKVGFS